MSWKALAWGSQPTTGNDATDGVGQKGEIASDRYDRDFYWDACSLTLYSYHDSVASLPKSLTEKVYEVLKFLKDVPMHKPVGAEEILTGIGININNDAELQKRLQENPKVVFASNMYAYQAKYDVKNVHQLLQVIEKNGNGLPMKDLEDCYVGIDQDIRSLLQEGSIIAVRTDSGGSGELILYPRGPKFLSQLSGTLSVEPGSNMSKTTCDLTTEVRRGDAIMVGEKWFRVSLAQKGSQAEPGPSMTQRKLVNSKKAKFIHNFDEQNLPLDNVWSSGGGEDGPLSGLTAFKFGCTNDLRQLWEDTLEGWPQDRATLEEQMVRAGLTSQDAVSVRRPVRKMRKDPVRRNQKQKGQRNIKLSNAHLIGTELGNLLQSGADGGHSLGAARFEKRS